MHQAAELNGVSEVHLYKALLLSCKVAAFSQPANLVRSNVCSHTGGGQHEGPKTDQIGFGFNWVMELRDVSGTLDFDQLRVHPDWDCI